MRRLIKILAASIGLLTFGALHASAQNTDKFSVTEGTESGTVRGHVEGH